MHERLPSLNGLRVFESAARLGSFRRASEELHLTEAAVSRQIRRLEGQLGVTLFRRAGRGLTLTEAGKRMRAPVARALGQLRGAVRVATGIRMERARERLVIAATPGIADAWLGARLGSFCRAADDIDPELLILVEAAEEVANGHVDAAVYWHPRTPAGVVSETLFSLSQFCVCSPDLLEERGPLKKVDDLARYTLLHWLSREWWRRWLRKCRINGVDWRNGPVVSDSSVCMEMAVAGQGVALGDEIISGDYLLSGRLVKPLGDTTTSIPPIRLALRPDTQHRRSLTMFRGWLHDELRRFSDETALLRETRPYGALLPKG